MSKAMASGPTRRQFMAGASAALGAGLLAGPARAQGTAKTITTLNGTYDIPLNPQRLVLMGNRLDLETSLALGLSPVAMGFEYKFNNSHADVVAPWVPYDPANIEIFDWQEVTAEQILSYEPDLIFARYQEAEWKPERFAAISKIAPVIPIGEGTWREDLTQVAGWLERSDALARVFAEHDTLRDDIKARHGERIASAKVSFGSVEPPVVWLCDHKAAVPAAQSHADLGGQILPWPGAASDEFEGWMELSPENLGLIGESDAILFWAPTREILDEFVSTSPLWDRLPPVAAGRAVLAPNNVGSGSVYTIMETLRLWDQVYGTLA